MDRPVGHPVPEQIRIALPMEFMCLLGKSLFLVLVNMCWFCLNLGALLSFLSHHFWPWLSCNLIHYSLLQFWHPSYFTETSSLLLNIKPSEKSSVVWWLSCLGITIRTQLNWWMNDCLMFFLENNKKLMLSFSRHHCKFIGISCFDGKYILYS